jgi:acetyl-CoA decarbonylase/synthase complex subunit epsilon
MVRPYQKPNVNPDMGVSVYEPETMANILKVQGKRKLFIIGAESLTWELNGKKVIDYYIDIVKKLNIPVVATGHTYKELAEKLGKDNVKMMSLENITQRLSDPEWKGFDGQGQYNIAIFGGHLVYYVSQAMSNLKNFALNLRTINLDKYAHPNARFSLANLSDTEWKEFLEKLLINL